MERPERCEPVLDRDRAGQLGKLVKRGDAFFTWPNDYTNPYHGLEPVFLEDAWWEPYPDIQIASLRLLLTDIQNRYSIGSVVGHKDVSPGRKADPGPALATTMI